MLWLLIPLALAWPLAGPDGVPTGQQVQALAHFAPASASTLPVATDPDDLATVAGSTLAYLQQRSPADPAVTAGILADLGVDLDHVERTLAFVVRVAAEDRGADTQRLLDPSFLAEHFTWYAWSPDRTGAEARGLDLPDDRIRMTRYLIYQAQGRLAPEGPYRHALYMPPSGLDPTTLTRQQVMAGAFEPGGQAQGQATALVYLTAEGVYDALMQGTIEVRLPQGPARLFNVDTHNGHPYDADVRDPSLQARYWYFREVTDIRGWADIKLRPAAAVAGDIYNLGLGKLVALQIPDQAGQPQLHLAVLADTGGAFQPNLFQLDYLAGTFPDHATFQAATGHMGPTVAASILLLRE